MMNPAVAPHQPQHLHSVQNSSTRRSINRPIANNNYISDCPPETQSNSRTSSPSLGKRSVSLTTLQAATIFEPRMAQLETLEAKMASIEVSLSSTPRRKKNGSLNGLSMGLNATSTSTASMRSKELAAKELETLRNALRDKENIIQSLKGQLTVPGAIRLNNNPLRNNNNNNNGNNNINGNVELTEVEKKQAEDRLSRLKSDVDNKRLAIKNLKIALERLDITDNIDIRIQQAELEYQLGREELNLLTLLEEMRALQLCIEESNKNSSDSHTLFSCIKDNEYVILQAIEVTYDIKNPKFGAGPKENIPGLWVDWALEETGLLKEDRLVEVNGKIVLTKSRDDLNRLLAAAPDPAQLVVLRRITQNSTKIKNSSSNEVSALRSELEEVRERAEEAQKIKDGLKSDNIRLTHRISYLEEQVSELLNRKSTERLSNVITSVKSNQNVTNITLSTAPTNGNVLDKEMQVFQRGSQITALSLDGKDSKISLPVRSKSSLSNVSNTQITQEPTTHHCHKNHRHKHRLRSSLGNQSDNQSEYYRKHHHHHHKDYNSETNSVDHHVNRQNKRNVEYHRLSDLKSEKDYLDQSYKKATKIVQDLTKNKDSLYEKHKQKCITASEKYNSDILKHYNARKSTSVLDFRSEIHIGPKYDSKSVEELDNGHDNGNCTRPFKKVDLRSVKSLDFDSDCKSTDYASEPLENNNRKLYYNYGDAVKATRPTPPKKPLRLSLHKTQSLQSVETSNHHLPSNIDLIKESRKRNHRGEIGAKLAEDHNHSNGQLKWIQYKKKEGSLEKSSWC